MKAIAKLFLREWKYLLKRPRTLILMVFRFLLRFSAAKVIRRDILKT